MARSHGQPGDHRPLIIYRRWRAREIERLTGPLAPPPLTHQAVAGYARSVAGKRARHLRTWGLFAGLVEPPPILSLEEHRARKVAAAETAWRAARREWASNWRKVRKRLRELPRHRALELLDEWNAPYLQTGTKERAGPFDLVLFLDSREPPAALQEHRRQARLQSAALHRRVMREEESWYVEHVTCPEESFGVADLHTMPRRMIRCIACEEEWRTRQSVEAAQEHGILRIIDCRQAEQLELEPLPSPGPEAG